MVGVLAVWSPALCQLRCKEFQRLQKLQGSTVVFDDGSCPKKAASLAAESDVTIVFVGTVSSEGHDRESLSLDTGVDWKNQNEVVDAIANKTSETVVVATTPGAILLPWSQKVKAILTNFMPGQQAGNAIADVLFGKVNPSGKMPLTFPNRENEMDFSQAQYPGLTDPNNPTYVFYTEKRVVGYRYYEEHNINFTTGFPFGHGLSYTSFQYSSLVIHSKSTGIDVSFKVQNSGHQPGSRGGSAISSLPISSSRTPTTQRFPEDIHLETRRNGRNHYAFASQRSFHLGYNES